MTNLMRYKGYLGTIESSEEDDVLFGKAVGIRDLISYEGDSLKEIKKSFEEAIDHYLETCKYENLEPNTTSIERMQKELTEKFERNMKSLAVM